MNLRAFGKTDTGHKRKNNEDSFLIDDSLRLYVVADGMGGHQGGETASLIAVETLSQLLPDMLKSSPPNDRSCDEKSSILALKQAVFLANQKIFQAASDNPALSGMGTTVTAFLVRGEAAYIAHVGDSRAYMLRDGMLKQVTSDHTIVADRVRAGLLTPEQAKTDPYRHIITRALGIDNTVAIEHHTLQIRHHDVFLLCTDGLTEMVEDGDLREALSEEHPHAAVEKLIHLANDRGGVDNITAVVVHVKDE